MASFQMLEIESVLISNGVSFQSPVYFMSFTCNSSYHTLLGAMSFSAAEIAKRQQVLSANRVANIAEGDAARSERMSSCNTPGFAKGKAKTKATA